MDNQEKSIYAYFIDTHNKSKNLNISLSPEYKGGDLEIIDLDEKDIKEIEMDDSLSTKIYKFKIIPDLLKKDEEKNVYLVTVLVVEENGYKHEFVLKIIDPQKDYYEYNFEIEKIGLIPLRYEQQFEIYVKLLRKNYKQNTDENKYLMLSTQPLIAPPNKTYDLLFYILIFQECFTTDYSFIHLNLFEPKKIKGLGKVSDKKFTQIKNILKTIFKKPERLHIGNENDRQKTIDLFNTLVLYFNLNFNQDALPEMYGNEQLYDFLYDKLLSFTRSYGLTIIRKNIVVELLKKAKKFEHFLHFISHIGKDTIQFLEFVNEQKELLTEKIKEETKNVEEQNKTIKNKKNKKEMPIIDIENFVEPKKEDDIKKLNDLINQIKVFQSTGNKIIKFLPSFIDKYISFFDGLNLDNLLLLKGVIGVIKEMDPQFETKQKIEKIIHENGLNLVLKGQLKNKQILDFILIDDYYQNNNYDKKERVLTIFDGIDISSLEADFFETWKKINFKKMFETQFNDFLKKIASFIKEMKDFGLIYKFYEFFQDTEYKDEYITNMQQLFKNIFKTYSVEKCPDFNKDVVKLICLTDKKKVDLKKFLEGFFQNKLDFEKVKEIYLQIIEEYQDISKDLKDIIVNYFTKNKNNSNPSNLIELIKICPKLRKDIFLNVNKFIIKEEDFFSPEETENYKFFKGLVKNNFLADEAQNKGDNYISQVKTVISSLEEKIKKFDISFNGLSIFFPDIATGKSEITLKERLSYLNLGDENKAKKDFDIIKSKILEIKNYIKDLEIINRDFSDFFYSSRSGDIKALNILINTLKNQNLNYFDKNCKKEYDNYKKFLKDAKTRERNKVSIIFNELYKLSKNKYKNDDKKRLEDIEKNFKEFKKIFKKNGITNINENILESVLIPFRNEEKNIEKELIMLSAIFGIKDNSLETTKEEITLISKKKFIFDIAVGIKIFIENSKVKPTNYYDQIKNIINNLQEKKDIINTIRKCYETLKNLKILNEKENDNGYLDILIKFKEHPESIPFLFETSLQEIGTLQESAMDDDNNYVTVNDVVDMGKCIEFLKDIGLKDLNNMQDDKAIEILREKTSEKNGIFVYFERFINNYEQIKLLKSSINKSEVLKYQIQAILKKSTFILSNVKNNNFKCEYIENIKEPHNKVLNSEDIISLRERALLSKKIADDYKYFIDTMAEILKISNTLKEIYLKGYPKIIEIKIDIIDKKLSNNFNEIIENLNKIVSLLKEKQKEGYEKKPLLRYIYGRQFNLLNDNFNYNNNDKNIISFLKYITNDLYKSKVTNFTKKEDGDIIDNINDCENYLNQVLKKNGITMNNIYEKTIITQKNMINKFKGVYIYYCEQLEKDLFQIYKYLTGNNPIAQNILLCNKDITNEEITAFLYRAILYQSGNSCFIIGGLELLGNAQKECLLNLLNIFFSKGDEKKESCLILFYLSKSSDIYNQLEKKSYKVLDIPKKKFESEKYTDTNIEIIKSDKSGVGKSTFIRTQIEKSGKKWIYFPFGGVITRQDIIDRLKNLNLDNNSVLHLDLYNTDQITLMMEFLFSMLITRYYGENEDIFYLSKDIQIKVEIPNTFIDFFEKFPILSLFQIKKMKISDIPNLIVPKELDSNIQLVTNYLKALKEDKIDLYDLAFPNITPEFIAKGYKIKTKGGERLTSINATVLPENECQQLIFEKIKEKINEPTYYQISSFINSLAVQLKKFNQNFHLAFQTILESKSNDFSVRTLIVKSFIELTKHFTKGAFTSLLQKQENVHRSLFGVYDEGKAIGNAVNDLAREEHDVISFKDIDPSLVFFHEKAEISFSIITNKNKNDQEYKNLLSIRNSQARNKKDLVELPNYKKYNQIQFLQELKEILAIQNPVEKTTNNGDKISLEEIAGNYVFTADNFVKMVLILLRIRANIPVIMMGETGCGKTSLIRKLSEMKNNGDKTKMKILNMHAGTNDNDIITFMKEKVIPEAEKITSDEKELKEKYKKENQFFEDTKLWVFFDEINTSKSMGLISELMCKHTCQGKPLPSNIVFIAACNPYRKRENIVNDERNQFGLDINQAHKQMKYLNVKELENIRRAKNSNLVYTVNPLPHSLLNFVFDFGSLLPEDEKDYIRCIIKEAINNKYYKGKMKPDEKYEDSKIKKLKKLASDMIIEAQNYIREFMDRSAVSLREIRRFNIFYEFFYDYLQIKKTFYEKEKQNELFEGGDKEFYQQLYDYSIQVYAINLSIFVCYYLRITDKEKRKTLYEKMNAILKGFDSSFKDIDFLKLPLIEERFIVNNIKLDKGIAKNRALLDNIFSLFIAINNKVPIFIVGKPGCSKSLTVQLIIKSMQGSGSDNSFFKKFPKIMVNSYQGSFASTSKGVENIFKKARDLYKNLSGEYKDKNISLIFFDEMGLAEHSPNNPLKVIHSELEYDQNEGEKKIAFIGISNWILDAAKMNRGISISIPEPDEKDIEETSLIIGKSFSEILANRYKNFFENLGKIYFNYKQYLKQNHNADGKEDFHGNRDFYHLIKNSSRTIVEKEKINQLNDDTLKESAIISIERNFAGIQLNNITSLEVFKGIFNKIYPCPVTKEYDVLKRIKENINDIYSRYLLIISKSSISTFLISSILSDEKKEYSFYLGSQFEQDLNKEEYAIKVLNKIKAYMENSHILVLKDLESVYPNLYDLFNQNFTVVSNRNYARLAVGSNTNTFSYVNNDFRCIISVDLDQINNEEAPFLNRFEKHIISFDFLLSEELIKESGKIKETLDELVKEDESKFKAINYDMKKLLINCNIEEIQALVYQANKEKKKNEEMNDYVLEKIALTLPQDIIINMYINGFKQKNLKSYEKIIEFYNRGVHNNFANFLKKTKNHKNLVYTFSNIFETINNIDGIKNPLVGIIGNNSIKQITINSITKEKELESQLDDFFNEDNEKICIIKFMPKEGSFMNYVKYFIENKEKDFENKPKKIFIFIAHITRILKKELNDMINMPLKEQKEIREKILEETLSNLSGFYQIFIDNLNGDNKLEIDQFLHMKNRELFKNILNLDKELTSNIFLTMSYIKYTITEPYKGLDQNNYSQKLIEFINKNERLRFLINECLLRNVQEEDLIIKLFMDKNAFTGQEVEILSVIKRYLSTKYKSQISLFFFKAEKGQFFSSLLSYSLTKEIWPQKKNNYIKEKKGEDNYEDRYVIEKIAKSYLDHLVYNDGLTRIVERPGSNRVNITLGLNIPGIKSVFNKIINEIKENIFKNYRNNESNLRNIFDDEEQIENEKKNYFKNLNMCNNSLNSLLSKEEILTNIINDFNDEKEKEELYNLLIDDYYRIFLSTYLQRKKEEKNEEEFLIIDDIENNKKFLNLMVNLRIEKIKDCLKGIQQKEDIMQKLANNINWVENYSEEISSFQKIFLKLSLKIPDLYEQITRIIKKKEIQYEISSRNPGYTSIVNEPFFLSLDSILRVITSRIEVYELPIDDFFDLIKTNEEILQSALKLEAYLSLKSKEVFSLQEILKLINAFYINKLGSVDNIKTIIKYFGSETESILEQKENKLCDNLEGFHKFLFETLGKIPKNNNFDFYKLLSFVFLNEFIKVTSDKFRELLLQKILENNSFIKNSTQIIQIILGNAMDFDPENMINNNNLIKEEDSSLFKKINDAQNEFLDEVIINIFETKINVYFESIPNLESNLLKKVFPKYYEDNNNAKIKNLTGIIFDNSLNIFQQTIKFLDSFSKDKNETIENNHLMKLYSIVYIKIYLSKFVSIIFEKNEEMKDIKKIMETIKTIKNKGFEKVIKIYILKLFFNLMNNNYEHFKKYDYKKVGIDFLKEFNIEKQDKIMLSYYFLPLEEDNYKNYLEEESLFASNNDFDPSRKEIADYIARDGIDTFLLVSINKMISNLGSNDYEKTGTYKRFSEYAKSLFSDNNKLKISKELVDLLLLFYNTDTYINKIKPNIPIEKEILDQKIFEILLYGFRYCVSTLDNLDNNNENKLYQSLLSKNCKNIIEKSLIPGNDIKEDLHLETLEDIKNHLEKFSNANGCYVCSCGFYYNIPPCGFPSKNKTFECPVCGEKCGWGPKVVPGGAENHGMVIRPGHYRIFRDLEQKKGQMRRWRDPDENIPNILLDDYEKNVIDPIKNQLSYGFNSVSRYFFLKQNKKVRKLSNIGYRLLNLISYFHLFYSYCLGNIEEEEMKKYLIKDTNIIKIIEIDWDLLKESLKLKNINSIQIFLNMIFKKLSKLIKECKFLTKESEREYFEKQVENIIAEGLKNYKDYYKKYNEENKKKLDLDVNDLKTLVTELIPPSENVYPEVAYPFFKYFILTKYKTKEDMLRRMDNIEKYPLLNQLIEDNPDVKKLSNLPPINDFINYMVEQYSFKISRDDAKKRVLENEKIFKTEVFKKKYDNFLKAWKEIKSKAIKYQCRDEMPVKDLSSKDKLIYFLNDNGELYNGMYLASACDKFIEWQNTFLQPIFNANAFNGILKYYAEAIKKRVPLQEVKNDQIVLIDERFKKSNYTSLNDVIYSFSERKIFNEDGKINYSDYNNFVYDYDSIEEELGKIILPGVCSFDKEDKLNFISFWGEGFRGGKSEIISKFIYKYHQKDLDNKEKEIIIQYIAKMNKEKMDKYKMKYDFKDFFASIQILIFYLTEKEIMKEDEKIINIVKSAPEFFILSKDCHNFFCNDACEITVNKLLSLFFYFEHLCFEDLEKTLQPEYQAKLSEEQKKAITNKLLNKKKDPKDIITIRDLAAATRRLISRYLAGKLEFTDIKEDADLATHLSRLELWEEKYSKIDEDLMTLVLNYLSEFKLIVGQAYEFYNLIGEEDRNSILYKNKKKKI